MVIGGVTMATSSIFANVIITDPKKVKKFVDVLEASAHDPKWEPGSLVGSQLTDIA